MDIVLDFDGTIVNSNRSKQQAIDSFCLSHFGQTFQSRSKLPPRLYNRYQQAEYCKQASLDTHEIRSLDRAVVSSYSPHILDPGFFSLCRFSRHYNVRLHLVSASEQNTLVSICSRIGIAHYFTTLTGTSNQFLKHCAFFRISSSFGVHPRRLLTIGDFIHDYTESEPYGFPFYGIYSHDLSLQLPNHRLYTNLLDLLPSLRRKLASP